MRFTCAMCMSQSLYYFMIFLWLLQMYKQIKLEKTFKMPNKPNKINICRNTYIHASGLQYDLSREHKFTCLPRLMRITNVQNDGTIQCKYNNFVSLKNNMPLRCSSFESAKILLVYSFRWTFQEISRRIGCANFAHFFHSPFANGCHSIMYWDRCKNNAQRFCAFFVKKNV